MTRLEIFAVAIIGGMVAWCFIRTIYEMIRP